jgi:3-isopropylmalate/(R)-2-methylmalate dehydratase small subunit
MSAGRAIRRVEGRGIPLRGDDIDTDRIIPGRFLRSVRFEGLEAHVFEDDRASWRGGGPHPFDDPVHRGASILIVNRNFGCGSSREHAPQALARWGIRAAVGASFSEIFFGNAVAIGLPCVSVSEEDARRLQDLVAASPAELIVVDLEGPSVTAGGRVVPARMPAAARDAFLSGRWDATGLLLDDVEQVEAVAARLPYVSGWRGGEP